MDVATTDIAGLPPGKFRKIGINHRAVDVDTETKPKETGRLFHGIAI